jgi:glucose/arabinose dehydrogenase
MRRGFSSRAAVAAAATVVLTGWLSEVSAADKGNAACPGEEVFYDPGRAQDVIVPRGFRVEVFAKDLNFPTAIAFEGSRANFKVHVLESGTGLPGRCNNNELSAFGSKFSASNPFTPDLLTFSPSGQRIGAPLGKPTGPTGGFQPDGPAIGLAFQRNFGGGTLFASDSNQGARGAPGEGNNTSRIVVVDSRTGSVTPFISGLPTGDHPTEQLVVKGPWIYWSQGSATNSGVTGHDNGAGGAQHDIACQDVTLSQNTWNSGDGHRTSGYSNHGVARPGARVKAFEDATKPGMCTGAILRARIAASSPADTIEPYSWGYRNPFGLRFSPLNHPLQGQLLVSENGEDERGARPTNNAPDRLAVARQNSDGTPDFHGWPDRFGYLESTQSVFNPIGTSGDDNADAMKGKPVLPVFASPPQPPVAPLALQPADVAVVGLDFAPSRFVGGVVRSGAALVSREGDFGFSSPNGAPEAGHDVELVNFARGQGGLRLNLSRFAFNCPAAAQRHRADGSPVCSRDSEQAFVQRVRGINRPVTAMFGPDGALYVVDYGAVRDAGGADRAAKFKVAGNGPLVQIPATGVVWRISRAR